MKFPRLRHLTTSSLIRTGFLVTALLAGFSSVRAELLIKPNDRLVINGDSITAQMLYSVYIEEYLLACQAVPNLKTESVGTGGATASFFAQRIESDVLPFKPTVSTCFFGMNDGHYQPSSQQNMDAYRTSLLEALQKLKTAGVQRLFVAGPGCVDPAIFNKATVSANDYNETLKQLSNIAKEVSAQVGGVFVDVHGIMMDTMTKAKADNNSTAFFKNGDGIHPSPASHLAITYAFLKAFGCDGNIGTITVDLSSGKAEATAGHKVVSVAPNAVTIESTRYPFCFFYLDPSDVLPYLPFNEELNRYILRVNGLPTAKAKVTWGASSKEFSVAELAKGINLAAEFKRNPFCEKFNALQEAVIYQQSMEGPMTTSTLHNAKRLTNHQPGQGDLINEIVANCMNLQDKLSDLTKGRIVPVKHTIKIEPLP